MKTTFKKLLFLSLTLFTYFLYADDAITGITISNASANEASGKMSFTVTIDELPLSILSPVRVDYSTLDGTATAGNDYTAKTSNIFTAVWFTSLSSSTSKTIEVDLLDDFDYEGSEYFYTKISTDTNGHVVTGDGTAIGVIGDEEIQPFELDKFDDNNITETDSDQIIQTIAYFNQDTSAPLTLTYHTEDNSALTGSDYIGATDTINVPAGVDNVSIPVTIKGDYTPESTKDFKIIIDSISTGTVTDNTAMVTITDDDTIEVDVNCKDVQEGASGESNDIQCKIFLSKPYPTGEANFTVDYTSQDGSSPSATAGDDYTAVSGSVTFTTGDTEHIINISTIGDNILEPDENVQLAISGSSYIIDHDSEAVIFNDDGDFPGISFDKNKFSIEEGDSGQKMLEFNLTLAKPAIAGASFSYDTWDDSAEDEVKDNDYLWTNGEKNVTIGATNVSISVPIIGDTNIENNESFYFGISHIKNLTLTGDNEAKGIIINDDGSYPTLTFTDISTSIIEKNSGTQELNITLTLDQPARANSSFDYFTTDDTAMWADDDYDNLSGTYTIAQGEQNITISIIIHGDTYVEPDETFTLSINNPKNILLNSSSIEKVITIENDDIDDKFSCSIDAYVFGSTAYNSQTDAYGFNLTDGTNIFKRLNIHPSNINAIGYNTTDNYIWGYDRENYRVVHINKKFEVIPHDITGLPTFSPADDINPTYHVGDVSLDGILHLFTISDKSTIYRVDVNNKSVNYLTSLSTINLSRPLDISDFAFSPKDNLLYAVDYDENLIKIDQNTGIVTNLGHLTMPSEGNVVSVFFDVDGNLYAHHTVVGGDTGNIYMIVPPTTVKSSIRATYFSDIGASTHGDGARCPLAPIVQHSEEPFICDESMYISSSTNRTNPTSRGKMWLHKIDTTQNPFEFLVVDKLGSDKLYNALAYADSGDINTSNYIFGLYFKELIKLSKTGKVISLGEVTALPDLLNKKQLFAGAIYGDYYYVSGLGQDYEIIYKIKLSDKTVSTITLDKAISLLDFSFTPDGKYLHGIVDDGRMVKIDVSSGIVNYIGTAHTGYQFDSTFSDKNGRFFANDSKGNGFFEFNLQTGKKLFLSSSDKADFNDGANCLKEALVFTDYGDAPKSYGPVWHNIENNIYLGTNVDHDIKAHDTLYADGDDLDGIDDEDGITLSDGSDINGTYFKLEAEQSIKVTLSKDAYLKIWIDKNIKGHFDATDIIYNSSSKLSAGEHTIKFTLPAGLQTNKITYLRARVSSQSSMNPVGFVSDGEVEDYAVMFGSKIIKGHFNIERIGSETYNINSNERNAWYTQIVGRDFDYSLVFYNESFTEEQNISQVAAKIELVDTKSDKPLYERYIYIAENAVKSRFTFDSKNSPADDLSEQSSSSFPPIPASKDVHFRVTYPKDSSGNIIQSKCLTDAKTCFNTLTETKTDDARDNFAIRPDNFYVTISDRNTEKVNSQNSPASVRLAAGYDYNLTTTATRYMTAIPAIGYTTTINEEFDFNSTGTCASTKPIKLSLNFNNGKFKTKTFSHDNVGKYILDINDSNWTDIDQNPKLFGCIENSSTHIADSKGRIGCAISIYLNNIEMYFQPDHFDVDLTMKNLPSSGHPDFIYMMELNQTNDNVAIAFEGNITAMSEDNTTVTTNFTTDCVATNLLLDLNATTISVALNNSIAMNQQIVTVEGKDVNFSRVIRFNDETDPAKFNVNNSIRRIGKILPIDSARFLNENNGTMSLDMRYNLNKNIKQAINPVEVTFNSIKVTAPDANSSAHEKSSYIPDGNSTFSDNVKNFYFARVVSNLNNYPKVNMHISPLVRTPLNVDIYCGTPLANYCLDRNVIANSNVAGTVREQNGWYISSKHNGELDGNVTKLLDSPKIVTITPDPNNDIPLNKGSNGTVNEEFNNCNQSMVTITIKTDPVLAFEPSEYTVSCTNIDPSQWTGIGKTGNVLEVHPKVHKTGKIDW